MSTSRDKKGPVVKSPVTAEADLLKVFQSSSPLRNAQELPETVASIVSYKKTFDSFSLFARGSRGSKIWIKLDILHPQVFRLRMSPSGAVPDNSQPLLVKTDWGRVSYKFKETEKTLEFETAHLKLVVSKDPWGWEMFDRQGNLITAEQTDDRDFVNKGRADTAYEARPLGFDNKDAVRCFESLQVFPDEHFYGFGEQYGALDMRNRKIDVVVRDGVGTTSHRSYKVVPFYMSTRGYGLFVNSTFPMAFDMGQRSLISAELTLESDLLDYFIFYGPSFKTILDLYTGLTGRPPVPPFWSFGLWMSRCAYKNREEVEGIARQLRERQIPCDVLHIDPPWLKNAQVMGDQCDFEINTKDFPDLEGMCRGLKKDGFRVSLWENPYLYRQLPAFKNNPGMYPVKEGKPAPPSHNPELALYDFTDPKTVRWHHKQRRTLFDKGVAVFKTDYGEAVPADCTFKNGQTGKQMHNAYPLYYGKTVFEVTEKANGEGIVWARSAYAGSQRYPVQWAGDSNPTFEAMAATLRGGLSLALSGFGFWSHDIGGFFPAHTDAELYIRWAQFGLLCSHARCHGVGPREPWAFGEDAERIFKKYANLRYRLLPYLYACAHEAHETGLPVLRPLILEFQGDPAVRNVDLQYMLGPSLLVAPVFGRESKRELYLPKGVWYDYERRERYEGGRWITYDAPLDVLPLFVKEDTLLPMYKAAPHTGAVDRNTIDFDVQVDKRCEAVVYSDQKPLRVKAVKKDGSITITVGVSSGRYRFIVRSVTAGNFTVACNGNAVVGAEIDAGVGCLVVPVVAESEKLAVSVGGKSI